MFLPENFSNFFFVFAHMPYFWFTQEILLKMMINVESYVHNPMSTLHIYNMAGTRITQRPNTYNPFMTLNPGPFEFVVALEK